MINVEQILKDILNGLENILDFYDQHIEPAINQYCSLYGPNLSEACQGFFDSISEIILAPVSRLFFFIVIILSNGEYNLKEICESLLFCP